jgi:OmpA-OmpF porin, OOP family
MDEAREELMRKMQFLAVGAALMLGLTGCAMQDRRWGSCAVAGGVIGGVIGGTAGGVIANNVDNDPTDSERAGAIAGGAGGGALLGALLGHAICDPEVEAPPPPPAAAPPPPPPAQKPLVTLHGANFDFDKATLKANAKPLLDEAAATMKSKPDMNVSIEGHTDSVGSDAYNQKLSERRAKAVRDYLADEGVSSSRMTIIGWGESKPAESNDTAEGRAENRRVEVIPK